jgi:hypothetical protein
MNYNFCGNLLQYKRCDKKWSTFSKSGSKIGVLFQKVGQKVTHLPSNENLSSKEVGQKLEHLSEK